jgi:hypothetical protein
LSNQEHAFNVDILTREEELAQQLSYHDDTNGFADAKATETHF